MDPITLALLAIVGVGGFGAAATIIKSSVFIVHEKEERMIESFGKYSKTANKPGLNFKLPWPLQSLAAKVPTSRLNDHAELVTKTEDNINVTVPIKIHFSIEDSKKFNYDAQSPIEQTKNRVTNTVKEIIAHMNFDDLYRSRNVISDQVLEKVGGGIRETFGIRLDDIIVDEPQAEKEIRKSYDDRRRSENEKIVAANEAEAKKIRTIADAEARKQAQILDGEGIAGKREAIFNNYARQLQKLQKEGVSDEMAHQTITLAMTYDTLRDVGDKGNLIISTTNPSEILSQMQALGKQLTRPPVVKPDPANDDEHHSKATPAARPPKAG